MPGKYRNKTLIKSFADKLAIICANFIVSLVSITNQAYRLLLKAFD